MNKNELTPNGTAIDVISKAYRIVDTEPHFNSSSNNVGHVLEFKSQQLLISYNDIK